MTQLFLCSDFFFFLIEPTPWMHHPSLLTTPINIQYIKWMPLKWIFCNSTAEIVNMKFMCSLQELKVTSCSGPGLHGDQMLSAMSRLCDRVTSVDVSWSGATDAGVKALRDRGKGSVSDTQLPLPALTWAPNWVKVTVWPQNMRISLTSCGVLLNEVVFF